MSIQIQGNSGVVAEVDGTTYRAIRITARPVDYGALGIYAVGVATAVYTGLAALAPLFSMRWGDATRLCLILRVKCYVHTTVAATVAALTERDLIIARGFTVSDSGGTAITLTGNNQKLRTSMGTSLVTDMRVSSGLALTPGTRTLDANPIAKVLAWSALNFTGMTIGGGGGAATGAVWANAGGVEPVTMFEGVDVQTHPIVLVQNEGIIMRIGAIQPTSSTQITTLNLMWAEVAAY